MNNAPFAMSRAAHILLLVLWIVPLSTCAQDATFRVDGIDFVRGTVTVGVGQKEAAAADLDGDGHPELVIAGNDSLTILRGDGSGNVVMQSRVPAGPNPEGPALADLDGDGHADVAVANHETEHLTLLRGDGEGGVQAFPNSPLTIDVDPHPHAVRAADLDADGHVDLVVDHRAGEGLLILRGMGGGAFESPGTLVDGGGDPYRGMAVGDLNGDGALDLVTPNPHAVGVMLSVDSERLTFARDAIATEAGPFAVDLGDLNGDGRMDVVAASGEGSSLIQLFLGDGEGSFREAEDSPFRLAEGGKQIARGDFNGDGVDDAAIAGWNAPEVLLLLGGARSVQTVRLPGAENSWGLVATDLNGDGADDLVIPDAASDQAVIYVSRPR